ncbi:right-handed parallel beta-helix repeat-containing protein [bacterium]|nr:right-handed parallel beta-helix repeat-containing protein [bacterium]
MRNGIFLLLLLMFFFAGSLFFTGCLWQKDDSVIDKISGTESGEIQIKLDFNQQGKIMHKAPADVTLIKVTISSSTTITQTFTPSAGSGLIPNVPTGTATVKVEGLNSVGTQLYSGENTVTIIAGGVAVVNIQLVSSVISQNIIYVNKLASGSNDGTSWSNAFTDLQSAIETVPVGGEIWVAAETYFPSKDVSFNLTPADSRTKTFVLPNGVKILGGFVGSETLETQRNPETNITELNGDLGISADNSDNCYNVVIVASGSPAAEINGFLISNGNANDMVTDGGGIYLVSSSPIIRNCKFQFNTANGGGAAIYVDSSSPIIDNCIFDQNTSTSGMIGGGAIYSNSILTIQNCAFTQNLAELGGAIQFSGGTATVQDCTFQSNMANVNGGAIHNFNGGDPVISRCVFEFNSASYGGAILNDTSTPSKIEKCYFVENDVTGDGGAIYNYASNPPIENCVFYANQAADYGGAIKISDTVNLMAIANCTFSKNEVNNINGHGGAVYISSSLPFFTVEVVNCIFWNNLGYDGRDIAVANSNFEIGHSLILSTAAPYFYLDGSVTFWNNNFLQTGDPIFMDPLNPAGADTMYYTTDDGFFLGGGSPAKNTGTSSAGVPIPATDIVNNSRPLSGAYDMGAYEQ